MSRVDRIFHRRSLTLASAALFLSVWAAAEVLGLGAQLSRSPESVSCCSLVCVVSWCVLAVTVCVHAIANLIADVERGYSPGRCQIAAVLLLFAFSLSAWLLTHLIQAVLGGRSP